MTRPILARAGYVFLAALATWLVLESAARQAALVDLPPMPGRSW